MRKAKQMAIKQQIKFKDEINFEADQQDAMKRTDNIQSLADQVEKLESLQTRLELQEENMKTLKIIMYLRFTSYKKLLAHVQVILK